MPVFTAPSKVKVEFKIRYKVQSRTVDIEERVKHWWFGFKRIKKERVLSKWSDPQYVDTTLSGCNAALDLEDVHKIEVGKCGRGSIDNLQSDYEFTYEYDYVNSSYTSNPLNRYTAVDEPDIWTIKFTMKDSHLDDVTWMFKTVQERDTEFDYLVDKGLTST